MQLPLDLDAIIMTIIKIMIAFLRCFMYYNYFCIFPPLIHTITLNITTVTIF